MKLLNIMLMFDDFVNIRCDEVLDKRFDITITRTHCVRIEDFGGIPEWSVRSRGTMAHSYWSRHVSTAALRPSLF